VLFYNWLFVFKIKGIFGKKIQPKNMLKGVVSFIYSIDIDFLFNILRNLFGSQKNFVAGSLMIRHGNKTHTRGYSPESNSIWRIFSVLTEFGYGFGFSLILKHGYGTDNGYIGTHPKPIPKLVPNAKKNTFMLICDVICLIIVV